MPANPFNGFTEYGIGIGLRVPHYRHILVNFQGPAPVNHEILGNDPA